MGFRFIWEALKIEKLPSVKAVRYSFLFLFLIGTVLYLTSPKDPPLEAFIYSLNAFLVEGKSFPLPSLYLFLEAGKDVLLSGIALFFILYYALLYLLEKNPDYTNSFIDISLPQMEFELPPKLANMSVFMVALRYYPYLLLLAFSLISLHIASLPLYGVPYYMVATMLSLTVFEQIFSGSNLFESMEASARLTRGLKFFMFLQFFVLHTVLMLLRGVLTRMVLANWWSSGILRAFFYALLTLAFGRMIGIIYKTAKFTNQANIIWNNNNL